MRRFFFDDGKSRKLWQIEIQGKKQVVRFGRIGATLKESIKTFSTPKEAKDATDKLIASKCKEGYVEIDVSRLEISRPKGCELATKKSILAFEKSLGVTLPEEYKNFLSTTNGGYLSDWYVKTPGIRSIDNVDVSIFYGLLPEKNRLSLQKGIQKHGPILPKGHLPIACGSDVFTLSLSGKNPGCVFFWDHETNTSMNDDKFVESNGYLLAGSFDEFLTRIATFYDDPEPEVKLSPSKSSASKKPNFRKLLSLFNRPHNDQTAEAISLEIEAQGGDLSSIQDGELPFNNIRHTGVLRALLKAKLNPSLVDVEGHPLIWLAAGSAPCIDLLVKAGANVNQKDREGESPLLRAVFVESKAGVKKLLALGANPKVRLPKSTRSGLRYIDELRALVEAAK